MFNPDPTKQAVEITFSRKKNDHPLVFFKDTPVKKESGNKHLEMVLDSRLSLKQKDAIGMLHFLSKYLPRQKLIEFINYMFDHISITVMLSIKFRIKPANSVKI